MESDIGYLMRMLHAHGGIMALNLAIEQWRWDVFAGKIAPAQYNDAWWQRRLQYLGVVPPAPRPADAFDPGALYHIAAFLPSIRYFLAEVYQFQFHRAACRIAGWTGPLHRCSIYGNKEVGERFKAMLQMGSSRPWPEALLAFTGEREMDASAILDYFAPLDRWLTEQNKGETCGW